MRVCIDTSILIDILKDEFRPFQEKLYEAMEKNETLVAPSVVFGELMPQFKGNEKEVADFLADHKIEIEPLDKASVVAAARSWINYLPRKEKLKCPHCDKSLPGRAHFLSDFLIGGFATVTCDAILTRDRGIYVKYFPDLSGYAGCLASTT